MESLQQYREAIMTKPYVLDFVSMPYDAEPEYIRVGIAHFPAPNGAPSFYIKIILNPTDQKQPRLIIGCPDARAMDRPRSQVPAYIHKAMLDVLLVFTEIFEEMDCSRVNWIAAGNNEDNPGKEERRGLHWHLVARFPTGFKVADVYTITWPQGHFGEVPLAAEKQKLTDDQLRQFRDVLRFRLRERSALNTLFINTEEVVKPPPPSGTHYIKATV